MSTYRFHCTDESHHTTPHYTTTAHHTTAHHTSLHHTTPQHTTLHHTTHTHTRTHTRAHHRATETPSCFAPPPRAFPASGMVLKHAFTSRSRGLPCAQQQPT